MDIGGHGIDLIRSLTGKNIVRVLSLGKMSGEAGSYGWEGNLNGDELYAVQSYELESGLRVIHEIFWSQVSMTSRFEAEIYGRKGTLYIRNPFIGKDLYLGLSQGEANKGVDWKSPEYEKTSFGVYHHQLFIDDLRNGTSNSLGCADGFAAIAVIEAARRSMATGKWEDVLSPDHRQ